MTASAQLKMVTVAIDDLLLDPNNPRFVVDFDFEELVPDDQVEGRQEALLSRFQEKTDDDSGEEDESFFGIRPLIESMEQIGFVAIDRVVVRQLATKRKGRQKYLVIEGNRRVSAVKKLRERNRRERNPADKLLKPIADSLENLEVLLLDTDGLSDEELHDQVGVILGLRHYGQVLEWSAMARAKNIYQEYMQTPPALAEFTINSKRVSEVSSRLSVPRPDIKRALKTYVAYLQLKEVLPAGPKPDHYSLLQAVVINAKLRTHGYIEQDETTFKLTSNSLEKVNAVCQFEDRDDRDQKDKILIEPKSVTSFASLVADARGGADTGIMGFAQGVLQRVEAGETTLESGSDELKAFKVAREWTDSLRDCLKRVAALDPKEFVPEGNDLVQLESATKAFKNIRKILDV